jgi:hypothetical protein
MMEYRISGDMLRATTLADEITKGIAHELAEKIRKELPEVTKESVGFWTITSVPTARQAADLIDPEVK